MSIFIILFKTDNLRAQNKQLRSQDTIDTQVVTIVKPYTPKISDAFKLKQMPRMGRSKTPQKSVKYTIFSIPVASTFTPAKGNSVGLDKFKKEKLFQNYASLGYGNYGTILGNLYLNHRLGRGEQIGGSIEHHSSQGGIDDLQVDDDFSNNTVQVNYVKSMKAFVWNTDAAFQRQVVNWYGLPFETTRTLDPKQVFSTIELGSDVQFSKGIFRTGEIQFRRFSDAYESEEFYLKGETQFQLNLLDSPINSTIKVGYLKGSFIKNYIGSEAQNYGNIQLSLAPSYLFTQDNFTVSAGFKAYYLMDSEQNKNDFYIYPNVDVSYTVVNSIVVAYAGIKGDLHQNTYFDFVQINPFVSPMLEIKPSSIPYKAFIGTKGKLSQSIGYDLNGSFSREQNKALFRTHSIQNFSVPNNYNQGNSFGVVYDDVNVFNISGALEIDMSQNLNVRLKGDLYKFSSDVEPTAWNLPEFEASLFLDYQFSEKLAMAANLFYWGSREDTTNFEGMLVPEPIRPNVTLDPFLDANIQITYEITNQFGAFVKANNIANNSYNRWNHYHVQGFQILGGVSYKFDF
ncbi:MAG: TonB-dependent receptor [Flavobacteriaceae bacterium]|nr:TonB-dependent receptor [Flavobacteriaceae bacterium]